MFSLFLHGEVVGQILFGVVLFVCILGFVFYLATKGGQDKFK